MIISKFKLDDLGCFLPNQFSEPDDILPVLAGRGGWEAHTCWRKDFVVEVIAAVREYWRGCYEGFFLVSRDFHAENAMALREHIVTFMDARGAIRLQTESVSNEKLREWHKFLGFTLEGTKRKMMFNRDYDCWAIVREGA